MKCEYGCGEEAKFQFKNRKFCCSSHYSKCSFQKNNNSKRQPGKGFTKFEQQKILSNKKYIKELNGDNIDIDNLKRSRRIIITCPECNKIRNIILVDFLFSFTQLCQSCIKVGDRNVMKNPIHLQTLIKSLQNKDCSYTTTQWKANFSIDRIGTGNPMFGKKRNHSELTRSKISFAHLLNHSLEK